MVKRAVLVEKSWVDAAGMVGIFHYAVKVDEDWYEIERAGGKKGKKGGRNTINGDLHGKPKRSRETRITGTFTCAGSTQKTDEEILTFNGNWIARNPVYDPMIDNCQKYTLDLVQYLVGGSFKLEIPLASVNAWADGPGSHSVSKDGFNEARATTGKAGAQFGYLGVEAEGPSAGASFNDSFVGAEASLGRAEGQVLGVGLRLEPNVNTGVGVKGGQFQAKVAGFGFTAGKGLGIHTPLGSFGFGKF